MTYLPLTFTSKFILVNGCVHREIKGWVKDFTGLTSLWKRTTIDSVSIFEGKYSTLCGDGGQDLIVQFHNSALEEPLKRTYLTRGFEGNLTDKVRSNDFGKKTLLKGGHPSSACS
ncbi:MAG: hypothetical protein WD824_23305 [Cyclobacteriaceae bacterium]